MSFQCIQRRFIIPLFYVTICLKICAWRALMKTLYLVMNPEAGTLQGRRILADIISLFNRADYLVSAYMTEKRGDAEEFARLHGGKPDLLVVCGGDGTLNEAVSGLLAGGHDVPVGYIPCGSTNDFAAGLGIPSDGMKAAECIVSGVPHIMDIEIGRAHV